MKKRVAGRASGKNLLVCLWCSLAVALYPIAFLFFSNAREASLSDMAAPLALGLAMMAALALLCLLFSRDVFKAALVSAVAYLVVVNYGIFEKLVVRFLPQVRYWHLAPIVVAVLLHVVYFACCKLPKDFFKPGVQVVALVFTALILVNVVTAIPTIIARVQAQKALNESKAQTGVVSAASDEEHPNIYYLLFDEYSNFTVLEDHYDYDNAVLKDYLREHQFTISLDSRNETMSTHVITTNTLNLDYLVTSYMDYAQYRINPELFKVLASHGYDIHYYSTIDIQWDGSATEQSGSGSKGARTVDGQNMGDIFAQRTILYPWLTRDTSNADIELFYNEFNLLNDSIRLNDSNTFVYVHFSYPHVPYIFDEDGNYVGMDNRNNTGDKQYYLGQLKYVTKYMLDSLQRIMEADPGCVIILQSDHSDRHVGFPLGQGSETTTEEMVNILNAVYYGGETPPDISGLSAVNTMRTILNELLGTDYEMVEVPLFNAFE